MLCLSVTEEKMSEEVEWVKKSIQIIENISEMDLYVPFLFTYILHFFFPLMPWYKICEYSQQSIWLKFLRKEESQICPIKFII